jgi:glycosyltransferase involved in cell wall biosynthesis
MRILQVHARYRQPGGEDAVVATEAALLRGAGHEVDQFLDDNSYGFKAVRDLSLALWNPFVHGRLRAAARAIQPDVAHLHNTWFSLSASAASALAGSGVPVVMTLHNYRLACANALLYTQGDPCRRCLDGSAWNGLIHACYRGVVPSAIAAANLSVHRALGTWQRNVDLFVVLTEFGRGIALAAGMPPEKVVVKANSYPDPGPRGLPAEKSDIVLFAGRLSEEKGVVGLLEAWQARRPDGLRLVVAGDGPLRPELPAPPATQFLGAIPRTDVSRLMSSARALVFPSRCYEGQPMVLVEALAHGLPVLGSGLGATREVVGRLGHQWVVESEGGVLAWRDALELLTDDAMVREGSRLAREVYEEQHTPATGLWRLEAIYERAIAAKA